MTEPWRDYQPIWTGLDPENRAAELHRVLLGAVFVGKTEYHYETEEGMSVRPLLLFEKEGFGILALATSEPPRVGHAGQPWYSGLEEDRRDAAGWEEASGREVAWVGPGIEHVTERPGLVLQLGDMGIAILGSVFVLKDEGVLGGEGEDA